MKPYLFAAALLLIFSSCTKHYYPSAMFQNDVQYMSKPYSGDSVRHGTYVSGALLLTGNSGNIDDGASAGLLNIYQSYTLKNPNLNISYGVLGFAGNYRAGTDNTNISIDKNFYGLGVNFSMSPYINRGNVDWRIIGLDLTYTKEFGDYAAFRQRMLNTDKLTYYRKTDLFTYGLFTEAMVKVSPAVSLAFKIGLNNTPGQKQYINGIPFNNVGFNANVGVRHFSFNLAYKFMPTDAALILLGLQLGAAYRF
ncbi:hypothetical protein [Mucilaginibacter jinjuensis]|uniref:Outer membrane protein with beta-barrel domain n=1 Tax=Mucilaginibacter jinjuensis TaxID=1176721 RepID=A0ABY7T7B9_9SPHI|nr:hypothetical protein [Mucilaginibacter jinjuensis]WCT12395.1 hypothetical protein PQO05_00420 [Mucilaginibacter jinjuensis]